MLYVNYIPVKQERKRMSWEENADKHRVLKDNEKYIHGSKEKKMIPTTQQRILRLSKSPREIYQQSSPVTWAFMGRGEAGVQVSTSGHWSVHLKAKNKNCFALYKQKKSKSIESSKIFLIQFFTTGGP